MSIVIRPAGQADVPAILEMLPRLANFELPDRRHAPHLWEGDAELLQQWAKEEAQNCFVEVAMDADGTILGATLTSLREELLSHEPSAHLEVLVVANGAEGRGLGKQLMASAEQQARNRGAGSITLHVFGNNVRARALYQQLGYEEELLRCIKHFE